MDGCCRVCARSDEAKSFDLSTVSQITNARIDDMLVYCTQLEISTDDSYPQQICAECFLALNSAFVLRQLAYKSATSFEGIINSTLTATEDQPSKPVGQEDPLIELPALIIKEEANEDPLDVLFGNPVESTELQVSEEHHPDAISKRNQGESDKKSYLKEIKFTYLCKECHYRSPNSINFKRHQKKAKHFWFTKIRTTYKKKPVAQPADEAGNPIQEEPDEDFMKQIQAELERKSFPKGTRVTYICNECFYSSHNLTNFKRHQNSTKHSLYTKLRRNQDNKPKLSKTVAVEQNIIERIQADIDRKSFQRGTSVNYICNDCYYSSTNLTNFKRHQSTSKHSLYSKQRRTTDDKQPDHRPPPITGQMMKCGPRKLRKTLYRCQECPFANFSNFSFRRHQATKRHIGEVKYKYPFPAAVVTDLFKCPACGDVFTNTSQLADHVRQSQINYNDGGGGVGGSDDAVVDLLLDESSEATNDTEERQMDL